MHASKFNILDNEIEGVNSEMLKYISPLQYVKVEKMFNYRLLSQLCFSHSLKQYLFTVTLGSAHHAFEPPMARSLSSFA